MYKKITAFICGCFCHASLKRYLLAMKMILTLTLVAVMQVNASTYAQSVSIKASNISLKALFKELRKQTGYGFLYQEEDLKNTRNVSLNFIDEPIEKVLKYSFSNQPIVYNIDKKLVIITPKPIINEAQAEINIQGKVVDESGSPMVGVGVKVKNTNTTTVTDVKGVYKIKIMSNTATLVFSYVGYDSQERSVNADAVVNVTLKQNQTDLEQVVVIGYGEVAKKDLTGSVSNVKMSELQKAPVATFEQALAGRVAGVQVSSGDGQPGADMNIVIRGGNSLTQSNSPLYVIDGFPVEENLGSVLSPNDIESISILKDASATAIYGSRGANGVVIIETKKGKIGKPVVDYQSSVGLNNVTKKMELMSPYEFVRYQLEINPAQTEFVYLTEPNKKLDDYKNISTLDWQDKMFNSRLVQQHNISVTGGTGDTKYVASGSYFDQNGIIINSGYQRYQGRLMLDQKINKKVKFLLNINAGNEKNFGGVAASARASSTQPYSTYLMYQVWGARPVSAGLDLENETIDPEANDARFNPYISALNEFRQRINTTIFANSKINYNITQELELAISGGINHSAVKNEEFYNSQTSKGYPFPDNVLRVNGSITNNQLTSLLNENLLTYRKRFNKNSNLNVVGGFTVQKVSNEQDGFQAKNVPNEDLGISGIDEGEMSSLRSSKSVFTLVSFLGRVNYNYKSKYIFTASFRADASSKFSENNRWGYFPSGAFAWNMSKEKFMRSLDFISNAKLRASYGLTGNNRIGDFSYLSSISFPYGSYYSFNNQTPQQAAILNNYGNNDLKWESTGQLDFGLDLGLIKDRFNLTIDVYRKTTSDLLLKANVPYSTGFSSIFKNIGKVRNQGIEFTLGSTNIKSNNFQWSSDFNIAFNSNKILALADDQETMISTIGFPAPYSASQLYLAQVGGPAAVFYGYKWLGNYQVGDFDKQPDGSYLLKNTIPLNGNSRANIKPGDIKYDDINGDGIVNEKDRVVIGSALPKHIGGFNNNFSYKNFALNVFFQWSYGNHIYNANRDMFEGNIYSRFGLNQYATYVNRWTPDNPNNEYYRFGGQGPAGRFSSRTIEDGSFIRLKTVSLSYNLPSKLLSKIKVKSAGIFITGQNLYTWTKYSGMDPEVSVANTILTPGFDYSAYPRERTLVFGIKASL